MNRYESCVYSLQPAPERQISWIIQLDKDDRFHSIRTDVFRFVDRLEAAHFWRMVTSEGGAVQPTMSSRD